MVVEGEPGQGKSATAKWWSVQNGCVYIRAKRKWSGGWFLRELLGELRVMPEHSFERMFGQAVKAIGLRMTEARASGATWGIVIDEIDHVSKDSKILETLRDLTDLTEVPMIMVGMGRVKQALTRFPQVARRVAKYCEFESLPLDDCRALVQGRCEVPVDEALVRLLHRVSAGFSCEILEGIATIERAGKRLGGRAVTVQDLDGQPIINERSTGRAIIVRTA
ncbi:AAA domain-containing protein [Zavarzinia compransoris]|nr:AAA domain-containing protein [Zavarzinia compransoris]